MSAAPRRNSVPRSILLGIVGVILGVAIAEGMFELSIFAGPGDEEGALFVSLGLIIISW